MSVTRYLAFDYGAESGRAVVGTLEKGKLGLEEILRFPNEPAEVLGTQYWDVLAMHNNALKGMREYARRHGNHVDGIGIDTWALDFGLLARDGKLLQNPVCYRDKRTEGMVDFVHSRVPPRKLYDWTGIATLTIHTLFHLVALQQSKSPLLEVATRFLMMPDLLGYFLTGVQRCERTNAITTQIYDPRKGQWSREVFDAFELPLHIMPELVDPGTVLGELRDAVKQATGLSAGTVVSVCNHDTGSAVAAVPAEGQNWAFISSGTWSIVGALCDEVITTDLAYETRICNELTVDSFFLARNIMGLWLLQQARASWARQGQEYSYEELATLGAQAPEGGPILYPDDLSFLAPPDMVQAVREYCARTQQAQPDNLPAIVRCILESLALSYREALERMAAILNRQFEVIHVVGGGSRNELLCQFTADATGIPVLAGPVEATVAGNALVQALALGHVASPQEIRQIVRRSSDLVEYRPRAKEAWDARYEEYLRLV